MSEGAAKLLREAHQSSADPDEAWENMVELADDVEWDVENMLSDDRRS